MSSKEYRKGRVGEYEVKNLLTEAGINAIRIPLSGAASIKGDILLKDLGWTFDVKRRRSLPLWVKFDEGVNGVLLREDRNKRYIVLLGFSDFVKLLKTYIEYKYVKGGG